MRIDLSIAATLEGCMRSLASRVESGPRVGWYDTCALSVCRDLGDLLVELGRWERHPKGVGRRWFYRPLPEPPPDRVNSPAEYAPLRGGPHERNFGTFDVMAYRSDRRDLPHVALDFSTFDEDRHGSDGLILDVPADQLSGLIAFLQEVARCAEISTT